MQPESDIMASSNKRPHVVIIGAGLVGLSLAQALQHRQIPCTVYERDSDFEARGPGWGITLIWGLPILRSLIPARVFDRLDEAAVNPAAERAGEKGKFAFYNLQTGVARFETPAAERRRFKRNVLRSILSDGIDIRWSKQLVDTRQLGDGRVAALFADGTSAESNLIVGCDGSRSLMRNLLIGCEDLAMNRLPIRLLGASVILSSAVAQPVRDLDPYFMQGGDPSQDVFMFFSFLDTPSSNDRKDSDTYSCQIVVSWPFRPPMLPEMPSSASERLKLMKTFSKDWAAPFSTMIAAIPDDVVPTAITLEDWSPVAEGGSDGTSGERKKAWDNPSGNITLAGDSAHTMTMYRGEAFNHGLRDIESLLEHIEPVLEVRCATDGSSSSDLASAIAAYEAEMSARGALAVLASRRACLDAHEQEKITDQSPLVARRLPQYT